jgi:hypothetical protein
MSDDQLKPEPLYKIYKPFAIQIATFLGGPLVAGYLIAENFKLLGEPEKVRPTWIHTAIATALIYTAIFVIPGLDNAGYLFPILYSWIAFYVVQRYQGEKIRAHILNNGQFYSVWRAVLVSLIFALIMVVLFIVVLYFTDRSLLEKIIQQAKTQAK